MRNYCKTIGALAAVSALVAGNASAEVEYELHTGYSNEYLFRGLNLGQDLIEVGADVKTEAYGLGLSAGAWYGNVNNAQSNGLVVPGNSTASVDELDLYGQVSKDFSFLTASIGYISRQYSTDKTLGIDQGDSTQEVYFRVGRQFYGIDTSLTYYWDVETDNNGYSELAASKTWELKPCLNLNAGAVLGYLAEQGELTALTTKVSLDWGFAGTAKLSPYVAYSLSFCDSTKATASSSYYSHAKDQFVSGVMLSVGF